MNSFTKALKETKTKTKSVKSKSSVPIVENVPKEIKVAVDDYVSAISDKKEAEAEMVLYGGEILEFTRKYQDRKAFEGNFSKSYELKGKKSSIKVIAANKFSINLDDKKAIKKTLGKKFDTMIEEDWTVQIKPEVLENEELQEELMKLVGDRFSDFFESTSKLKVKASFDENVYTAVNTQEKLDYLRTLVKQNKASLK